MTCEQAIAYVHSKLRFGIKPGLSRIRALLEKMGNPQSSLTVVHLAGTNGKGSTCAMIGAMLCASGYKTGTYFSPFILDFRDRMQIDGRMIEREALARIVSEIHPLVEEMEAGGEVITEFELVTAAAFSWFAGEGCERVVLETGLGGRWDATNVVEDPLLTVITSLSLDHTQILGRTLREIAEEKCGIIKPDGQTVCAAGQEPEAMAVIRRVCAARENGLRVPNRERLSIVSAGLDGTRFLYENESYAVRMSGEYQTLNAITAIEAARILGLTQEHIIEGLSKAFLPARMEVVSREPLILLDGAHNPAAAKALRNALEALWPKPKAVAVMGVMADKDYRSVVSELAPFFERVYTCMPENPRALSAEKLGAEIEKAGGRAISCSSPQEALEKARRGLSGEEGLVICGSFYLAGELRRVLAGESNNGSPALIG